METKFPSIKLSKISKIYSGYAFKSKQLVRENGIPIIKIGNIQNRDVLTKCQDYLPNALFNEKLEKFVLKKDDILIAMTGAGSVGRVGKMRKVNGKFLVNQRVGIVRIDSNSADPEYIYQVISDGNYESILYQLGLGAGQPNISPKDIGSLIIPFPPLQTQKKIAAILSAYDDLIENNTRRIAILEEMAQALYREWFVDFRFPGHESVRKVKSELGIIPEGWEVKSVEDLCDFISRGVTPKYEPGSGRFIINQKANEGDKINFSNLKELKSDLFVPDSKFARTGDLLINCLGEGTIGRSHLFLYPDNEWAVDQHMSICRSSEFSITTYLYFIMASPEGQAKIQTLKSGGTNMTTFNISTLKSFKINLPPDEILNQFYEIVRVCFRIKEMLQRKNENLRYTRDLLLPRLIEGKIDVTEMKIPV